MYSCLGKSVGSDVYRYIIIIKSLKSVFNTFGAKIVIAEAPFNTQS
jgi:hypothetical protein